MKAMILAAGEGRRMRPLTDKVPKPLLEAGGKPLIVHLLERLAANGLHEIVINHAHLGEQLEAALGDGGRFGVRIRYSAEGAPLETAGGIIRALPLLGGGAFMVVNGDIWTEYPFKNLPGLEGSDLLAHLVLVPNPAHHPGGDFSLSEGGFVAPAAAGGPNYTYGGIAVFRSAFFAGCREGFRPLLPLLNRAIGAGQVSGELFEGGWIDVGTPERLQALDRRLREGAGAGR